MAIYSDDEMNRLWRRAECIDRLSRDEFPWEGWDAEFPDLAKKRRQQIETERGVE
jgi:hypothetical protein